MQKADRAKILAIYQETSHQNLAAIAWGRELLAYSTALAMTKAQLINLLDEDNTLRLLYSPSTH